jgi:hypothetical protein
MKFGVFTPELHWNQTCIQLSLRLVAVAAMRGTQKRMYSLSFVAVGTKDWGQIGNRLLREKPDLNAQLVAENDDGLGKRGVVGRSKWC